MQPAPGATGYERGTITPIGSNPSWPVIIDQRRSATVPHSALVDATAHLLQSTILSAPTAQRLLTSSTSSAWAVVEVPELAEPAPTLWL